MLGNVKKWYLTPVDAWVVRAHLRTFPIFLDVKARFPDIPIKKSARRLRAELQYDVMRDWIPGHLSESDDKTSRMDSMLLIYIPIVFAIVVSLFSAWLFRKSKHYMRGSAFGFALSNLFIIGFSLFIGSLLGLLVSLQINRLFFNYKVLEPALPNGLYLWYGFGPGPTPQFMSYWIYVEIICLVALLSLTILNFKGRNNFNLSKTV